LFINNKVTVVLGVLGAGTGNLYPSICLDAGPDPRLGMYLPLNVAKIPMSRGQWHRLEYVVVANTPGVRDGQATWWLDGQMLAHYTDIAWVPAGAPNYWMQLSIDPIWGGVGGTLPADQFLYIDHLYASGK
jgi:hypothetical protein